MEIIGNRRKKSFSSFSILFQIRTPFNYLLMNLIIAESLITMYGLPVDFMATYHFGWKMGEKLCKATGFILTTSGKTGILLPELFWPTVRKKNSSCQNIFLKLEAEGREFTNFLRSLEQFIQIVKVQNNFWYR